MRKGLVVSLTRAPWQRVRAMPSQQLIRGGKPRFAPNSARAAQARVRLERVDDQDEVVEPDDPFELESGP